MFYALSLFTVISWIPKGALFGVFLYLGVGAMHGNEIWHHLVLSTMYAKKRPPVPIVENVKCSTVQLYTLCQVCCRGYIRCSSVCICWLHISGASRGLGPNPFVLCFARFC